MLSYNRVILAIISIAFILRFYQLGTIPPSVNWDEAAHGYNAFSILKTGRDEYGKFLPLTFRSFDDYKPPLYIYLVIPSVAVFGLNDFAVRLPSALFGVLTVYFSYLLVSTLIKQKKIAVMTAFLLAISPWHLQFSRVAYENNVAVFFIVLGTWLLLNSFKNSKFLLFFFLSVLSFSLSLFLYQTPRLFTPLSSLVLLALFLKEIIHNKAKLILPVLLLVATMTIFIPHVFSQEGLTRFKGATIFEDKNLLFESSYKIQADKEIGQEIIGRIVHNRRLVYLPEILKGYFTHFNPSYLLINGDNERHHAPLVGVILLWSFPFIILGIYFLIIKNFNPKSKIIIFMWFLLAAVPAAVTIDIPHAHRTQVFLPMYQIFAAIGLVYSYLYIKQKKRFLSILAVGLLLNFIFYLHQYFIHIPAEFSKSWIYGRKEAALFTNNLKQNYDRIIVSTSLEKSNLMWLYYLKYDPKQYLAEGGTVSGGYLETKNKFDKFLFTPINYQKQTEEAKTLFVGKPQELENSTNVIKKINYLNGKPAIYIAE